MISIYMLTDPTGADTCYVGMTSQPVEARFKQHLIEKVCPPKRRWIQQLAAQRMQPVLTVLDVVPESDWRDAERDAIAMVRAVRGAHCLNVHAGGLSFH